MKDDLIRRKDVERMIEKALVGSKATKAILLNRLSVIPTAMDQNQIDKINLISDKINDLNSRMALINEKIENIKGEQK